jgi:endoglucanase
MNKLLVLLLGVVAIGQLTAVAQEIDPTLEMLRTLTEAPGPSGFEGPVRQIFEREMRALGADITHDGLGSVVACLRGANSGPRIMIEAHLDEVGLMVRYITQDGFVKFQPLGGWYDAALINQRWTILTRKGSVTALSGILDPHVGGPGKIEIASLRDNLFLDVGATSKAAAEAMGIRPGDFIAPWSPFTVLGNGRYAAKAWDDRVGLAMMIVGVRRMKERHVTTPNTMCFAGTVQEEIGNRGAVTATSMIKPDIGIALEVGTTADYPSTGPDRGEEHLGAGPGLMVYDSTMLPNLKLRDFFFQVAAEKNVPLQTDLIEIYGQDGQMMQKFGSGVPTVAFLVPTRYTHSHTGVIDRADFDRAVDVLVDVLSRLDAKTVQEITRFD